LLGNLYIIRNTVNDKVYIGKTYNTIEQRFKEHKQDAKRGIENKFYNAIRKYGNDKFYIELIAQFEEGILEEKEIEYIAKYDSYHNGYNSTLGGGGKRILELDEKAILNDWKNKMSINGIARKYRVGHEAIQLILIQNKVYEAVEPSEKISLVAYDENWNRIKIFNSRKECITYIRNELNMGIPFSICQRIDEACWKGNVAFTFKWQKKENIIYDNKEFNRAYDKEQYIAGYKCIEIDGVWFCLEQEGNTYLDIENRLIKKKEIIKKGKVIICPGKEKLEELVLNLSNLEIANMYGVTEATVRKWLQNYNVDSKFKIKQKEIRERVITLYNQGRTLTEISKELNIATDTVHKVFNEQGIKYIQKVIHTRVAKYSKQTGELLGEYNSYTEAGKSCGNKDFADKIRLCVEGKRKSAGGYIWKKIE